MTNTPDDAGTPYLPPPAAPVSGTPEGDAAAAAPTSAGTRTSRKVALIAAGVAAGAIGATALGASAATNGSGSTPTSSATASAQPGAPANVPDNRADGPHGDGVGGPGHAGVPGQNPNEKAVSADITAKLKAAALAKVPGATVDRIETDSGDAAYEAHLTKSDGTRVTVKFDKNLAVTGVEDGMGK